MLPTLKPAMGPYHPQSVHSRHYGKRFELSSLSLPITFLPSSILFSLFTSQYTYYLLSSLGFNNIPGKILITLGQVVQFILDCIACLFATFVFFYADESNPIFGYTYCKGTAVSGIGGTLLLLSYLVLFADLFKKGLKKPTGSRPSAKKTN